MAERSALVGLRASTDDCARVSAPTLVVSGEPALDRIVPADGTSDYLRLIPGARGARIEDSGHLGYITKPDVFAGIVKSFLDGQRHAAA
jgi:pimeloyl-ACP methyl ester carboxylesterase